MNTALKLFLFSLVAAKAAASQSADILAQAAREEAPRLEAAFEKLRSAPHSQASGAPATSDFGPSSVTEESFKGVLERMNRALTPIVKKKYGKVFLATGDWPAARTPESPGGSFYFPELPGVKPGSVWGVHITGWLAREPGFSTDSVALVLCHEFGHHLFGGEGEREADHFAPTCLGWLWSAADTADWMRRSASRVPPEIRNECAAAETAERRTFCERVFTEYLPTEAFRISAWREIFENESEWREEVPCRRRLLLDGVLGKPYAACATGASVSKRIFLSAAGPE